ncbi:hypothetical protein [Wenyingzhuangia sp. 2_MG-2023]|uniref:hypothetical protein n=1 Tax=Wenyingzhuangia sp. 2_MG-2023 TaxID=3062639 RepID=UPI0026E347DE|nr:hypothetical protein [Wenyingzhuangia sp. 2_MG-2023]MDO6739161.1 hypothetical protein [Wenyingzhuangia sp. 2_MG-2023]MDO6803650.1 hypothetical protein [Wenyingzhuangia sp. 1_MG-2023]
MKNLFLLSIFIFCNSCVVISPKKIQLVDNRTSKISQGIQITINEAPRPLGSNTTTIEIYDDSDNQLTRGKLVDKKEYKWLTVNNFKLDNGNYKLVTYFHYVGKDRLKTETTFEIDDNIVDIELEYPLFVTGKAKLKMNGINYEN